MKIRREEDRKVDEDEASVVVAVLGGKGVSRGGQKGLSVRQ